MINVVYMDTIGGYLKIEADKITDADVVTVIGSNVDKEAPYNVGDLKVTFSEDNPLEKKLVTPTKAKED
jgi:hypothetical protein